MDLLLAQHPVLALDESDDFFSGPLNTTAISKLCSVILAMVRLRLKVPQF